MSHHPDRPPVTVHAIIPREGDPSHCIVDTEGFIPCTEVQAGDPTYESVFRRLGKQGLGGILLAVGCRDVAFEAAATDPNSRRLHRVYRAEDTVGTLPDGDWTWGTPAIRLAPCQDSDSSV